LDLVDDDQPFQGFQRQGGIVQSPCVQRVFQVEVVGHPSRREVPGQGSLAALTRPEQGRNATALQSCIDLPAELCSFDPHD
jgi:hypothetical protein